MLETKLRQTLMSVSTAMLADARHSLRLPEAHLDSGIRPLLPFSKMVGSAVTVLLEVAQDEAHADLTALVQAYELKPELPGSVMVIQVAQELHGYGIFGDGAATMARQGGFVGAVVEGALRDTHELRQMMFPVFSRTIAPGCMQGKAISVAGEPVLVGGRMIHCGDVIVADNDGVVVIRPNELDKVVERTLAIQEWELRSQSLLAQGKTHEEMEQILGPMP